MTEKEIQNVFLAAGDIDYSPWWRRPFVRLGWVKRRGFIDDRIMDLVVNDPNFLDACVPDSMKGLGPWRYVPMHQSRPKGQTQ